MSARAVAKNAPLSAQKARLVADLVRNKTVDQAQDMLHYNGNRASHIIGKLLSSAVANASELDANEAWHDGEDLDSAALFVKRIVGDEGVTMKRIRPRARGMAYRILRRRCHITLEVDDR